MPPPFGSVNVRLGVLALDGDNGPTGSVYQGDQFRLNSTNLSDALNPANNFFNSTISYLGSYVTTKNPNYVNQLGFDADIINANGILANSATSGTLTLTTGGESYNPGVVTTAIVLYAPNMLLGKSYVDLNGGNVEIGDILEYTVTVTNNQDANGNGDPANQNVVTDPIPTYTTYVPGSLIIDGVSKTDATGDDQAEFDSGNNLTRFRIGTGANATTGGTLNVNPNPVFSSTVKFRVTINTNVPNNTQIINQAQETFKGQTLGQGTTLGAASPTATVTSSVPNGLSVNKTAAPDPVTAGNSLTYTITVVNGGPNPANSVVVNDPLPVGTVFQSISTPSGWTCTTPTVGTNGTINCTRATFGSSPYPVASQFLVTVLVSATQVADLSNTVSVTSSIGNASKTIITDVRPLPPTISLVKRITSLNGVNYTGFTGSTSDPNNNGDTTEDLYWPTPLSTYLRGVVNSPVVRPGDILEYTIYFLNSRNPASNLTLCDLVPTHQTFVPTGYNSASPHPLEAGAIPVDTGLAFASSSSSLPTLPTVYLTNVPDSDRGRYYTPGDGTAPSLCGANTNGAIVVKVVSGVTQLPAATAPGVPTNSYGFVRFKAAVN